MKRLFSAVLLVPFLAGMALADFSTNGPGFAILDFSTSTSVINGTGGGTVTGVDLVLNGLSHTWAGDLIIEVEHAGVIVNLSNRPGFPGLPFGTNVDYAGNFAFADGNPNLDAVVVAQGAGVLNGGTFSGNNPLANFNGLDADGAWTLRISDNAGGDQGSLAGWTLNVSTTVIPEPTTFGLLASLAGLGLIRRRR